MKKILLIMLCIVLLIGSVSSTDLTNGLVAHYKLDETTGAVIDSSGNGYNGVNNGTIRGVGGISGNAFNFTNSGNVNLNTGISTLLTDTGGNWSITGFFKTSTTEVDNIMGVRMPVPNANINLVINGKLSFSTYPEPISLTSDDTLNDSVWHSFAIIQDSSGNTLKMWINGTLQIDHDTKFSTQALTGDFYLGAENDLFDSRIDNPYSGLMDEVRFYNRTLTEEEVSELSELSLSLTPVTVTLVSPTNETIITTHSQNFTVNYTSTGINVTNVTYNIWYSNSTIFNQTTVNTNQAVANQTIQNISNFVLGDYLWNVEACGTNTTGVYCWWAEDNYTVSFAGEFSDYMFNTPIVETSRQTFYVLLETPEGTTIQAGSGKLNYNGTDYSSITATDLGSNQFNLSKTIYIPVGVSGFSSENRSFFWNITVVDITTGSTFIQTSDTYNQNVTELKFGLCSSVLTTPMLNFTLYDETLGTQINSTANAVTFQTTFKIGGHWSFMNKTVSVNNLSVDASEFDFCTNNPTNVFYTDMESFYEAVGFTGKNYYLTNATLTNTTNEINLYLLNESAAIEFFVTVEQDLSPIKSAQVTIQKYFVGEGVYKTVEIDETSSDTGEFTAYFDLDKDYKFVITKDGSVLGTVTKTASCKQAPCEMTLSLSSAVYDYYSVWGDEFASNVLYNLSYNPNTKIVTFDFIDTTGLANYFRMQTYEGKFNQSSTLIFDTTTYSSSGTITANLTAYDKGNFIVYTYVSRSPEIFIDYLKIFISNLAGTFGILGLFCAFLLVITIIFGLSHSPPTLILAVPLSLTIAVSIGILSISWGGVVLVWILAIISMWAVSR